MMIAPLLIFAASCHLHVTSFADVGQFNLLLLQGRIVLPQGGVGGVTFKPDPGLSNRSFDHSSRPLFGPEVSRAARTSSQRSSYPRYTSPAPQLINSRSVATEAVRRSVFGGYWGW